MGPNCCSYITQRGNNNSHNVVGIESISLKRKGFGGGGGNTGQNPNWNGRCSGVKNKRILNSIGDSQVFSQMSEQYDEDQRLDDS